MSNNTADILTARIAEIVPELDIESKLQKKYGEAIFLDATGRISGINQAFFAALFNFTRKPIFDAADKAFYLYNPQNGRWETQTEPRIIASLGDLLHEYAATHNCPDLNRKRTARGLTDVLLFLKSEAERRGAFDGKERRFVHCGNGVLEFDVKAGEWKLNSFSAEYFSRNKTEILYNPAATCPQFIDKLISPAMSVEDAELLQLYAGQCVIGYNLSQTFLMLTGTAGGGKSTLVNVLEGLIGRHNCTELRLEFMNRQFEIYRLIGKTLLTAKDVKSRFLNTDGASKLKALTGNDTLTAEIKGANGGIDVPGVFNAIITSNSTLRVALDGDNGAWRRRMLWIKYEAPAPERPIADFDKQLLAQEGSGILNWALEGAAKLIRAGGRIQRSATQIKRVDDLLLESDAITAFVKECVIASQGATITVSELLIAFNNYCDNRGWQTLPERVFQNQLPDAMLNIHRSARRNDIPRDGKSQKGYSGFKVIAHVT